jgi:hypothetical protein
MRNITDNIIEIRKEDVYAIPHLVSGGVWVNGFLTI